MLYLAVSSLFSHWRRHLGQALTLVAGLALATALWSGIQAINAEARSAYDQAAATLGQDTLDRLVPAYGDTIPRQTYVDLRRMGYAVSPVITGIYRTGDLRVRVLGIDPLTAPDAASAPVLIGEGSGPPVELTAFFGSPGVLLVGSGTDLDAFPPDGPRVQITGEVPAGAAVTDIGTAARLLGQQDPSYLLIDPDQPARLPVLPAETGLIREGPQSGADVGRLTDSFHLNLTAFGLLAFAVGLFIVHGAIGLSVEQRRATVRTLRSMGVPLRAVLAAFALEITAFAIVAGAVGLILGYLIAGALMPGVASTLRGLYGADVPGVLRFDPLWALAGAAMTFAGATVAAAQAFVKLAQMPLLAPAQPRAWAIASVRGMRWQAIGALTLGCGAVGILIVADGLLAGFGFLAGLLMGAALLLPLVLLGLLRGVSAFARGPQAEWILADTRQQIPSLSLALMALMLALAANIGVSTMVGSFRVTFLGWLDQRLASELYVTASTPDEATALAAYLAPRTEAILPITSVPVTLGDRPADLFGIVDHSTYRDHWPLLSGTSTVWTDLAQGRAVLVNEQLARRSDLSLGDPVTLTPGLTLPIAGVFSDYGNPNGQAIIGFDLFQATFPDRPTLRIALRLPLAEAQPLANDLRETFGLPDTAVVNQVEVKRFSLDVFDRTFQVTGALNVLTLAVAAFAILTSLLTLAGMRRPQLAPVWAIGLTRRRLSWIELGRAVFLAALTFLVAIPVGLVLAWALLAIVNVEAFGWRLPMRIFPGDWIWLGLSALVAAGLAAALPALHLRRIAPDQLLRVFAHDR